METFFEVTIFILFILGAIVVQILKAMQDKNFSFPDFTGKKKVKTVPDDHYEPLSPAKTAHKAPIIAEEVDIEEVKESTTIKKQTKPPQKPVGNESNQVLDNLNNLIHNNPQGMIVLHEILSKPKAYDSEKTTSH